MPRFAVYFVPDSSNELYRLGTSIVGYDVRGEQVNLAASELQERFATVVGRPGSRDGSRGAFDPSWVEKCGRFGFHLTIGDAIDCKTEALEAVEEKIGELLLCLNPEHSLELQPRDDGEWVGFFGKRIVALKYKPSDALRLLETLVVALVNPLGISSGEHRESNEKLRTEQPPSTLTFHEQRKLQFCSWTVFDSYLPHFTVLDPCPGLLEEAATRVLIREFLAWEFSEFRAGVRVTNVCMMVQDDCEKPWRIRREFPIGASPPLTPAVAPKAIGSENS